MKKRQKPLTDEQWELIEPLLPPLTQRRDKRGPKASPEPGLFRGHFVDSANGCGMAVSSGLVSGAPQPAGGDSINGRTKAPSGTRPSWTAASPRKKGGPAVGKNQAWQGGTGGEGTGRRSRSSDGSSAGKCLPQ